jgi:hypothetical protein
MGKRKKTHEYEDQYGGGSKAQDVEQFGLSKGMQQCGWYCPWPQPAARSTACSVEQQLELQLLTACCFVGPGGGGAAGKSRNSTSLNFERHVPKFLQPYAHLLGQKKQDEDEPQIVAAQQRMQEQEDDEDDDKVAEQVRCTAHPDQLGFAA